MKTSDRSSRVVPSNSPAIRNKNIVQNKTNSDMQKYLHVFVFAVLISCLLFLYLNILHLQKIFLFRYLTANTSLFLLAVMLLIGPYTKVFQPIGLLLKYRKHIGIVALIFAFLHVGLILFSSPSFFSVYRNYPLGTLLGFIGTVILICLYLISRKHIRSRLGSTLWWKLQYLGIRIGYIILLLHTATIRFPLWKWWLAENKNITRMPLSLLMFVLGFYVYLIKLCDYVMKKRKLIGFIVCTLAVFAPTIIFLFM